MSSQPPAPQAAQVVLRNVAELARLQQARELGSSLASQIFRLLKIAQLHSLDNMAVLHQLDQTVQALELFGSQTGEPLTLLFARSTVFVCGQLLKASRAEYESALELGQMVHRLGVTQLVIQNDAGRTDLTALCRLFQPPLKARAEHGLLEPSPRVRLRYVSAARLDENEQSMSPEDQILRTYATTVVVMRRVHENLGAGRYQLPNQAKRLAQRLVTLSEGDTPAFLGVTAMRNLNHDAAGRSVNRSILAVAMGRQLTSDLGTLSRIAMAALFFDVAMPLVTGTAGRGNQVLVPHLTEEAERRLPAATAAVLTALGQLREASLVRTVIAYEAHWLRQVDALGPMYDGEHRPMVASRIVATAHRFNQLMEPDLATSHAPSVDDAVAQIRSEARETLDQAMLVLLVGALGFFPRGTPVELSTGERAVVIRTPDNPADYPRPSVRIVYDAEGQLLKMKVAVALAGDPDRQVVRVITNPDPPLLEACRAVEQAMASQPSRARPSMRPSATSQRPSARSQRPSATSQRPTAPPSQRLVPSAPPAPVPSDRRAATPSAPPAPTPGARPSAPGLRAAAPSAAIEPSPRAISSVRPGAEPTPSGVQGGDPARSVPPSSTPSGMRMRRSSPSLVELDAPPSRRDPRSEDFEPESSPPPASSSSGQRRSASQPPPSLGLSDRSPHWSRPPVAPPSGRGRAGRMISGELRSPSASGSLERTPLSHVLLYVLDRGLGGTLVLTEPSAGADDEPVEHFVYFRRGIPTKAHTASRVAALGSMLVAYGVIDQLQLESAPVSQPPTNEATLERELLANGLARIEQLGEVRSEQLADRLCFLFGLPPGARYGFFSDFDLVEEKWGRVPGSVTPLAVLTRALRERPEEAAMDRLLGQLGDQCLALHPETDLLAFDFSEDELAVATAIAGQSPSLSQLMSGGHGGDVVRRVVYELVLAHAVTPPGHQS